MTSSLCFFPSGVDRKWNRQNDQGSTNVIQSSRGTRPVQGPSSALHFRYHADGVRFPLDAALHVVHDMIELTEKSLVRLFQTSPVWKKLIALRHEAVLESLKAVAHGARPRARSAAAPLAFVFRKNS